MLIENLSHSASLYSNAFTSLCLHESVICHACCDLAWFPILCTLFGMRVKLSLISWTIRILSQVFQNLEWMGRFRTCTFMLAIPVSFLFYLFFISFKQDVPTFCMYYALFKEQIGDAPAARSLFSKVSSNFTSGFYANINRLANMEKRMVYTNTFSPLLYLLICSRCWNIILLHYLNVHRETLKQPLRYMRKQLRMQCRRT